MTAAQEALIREADGCIKRILDGDSGGNSVSLLLQAHSALVEALFPGDEPELPRWVYEPTDRVGPEVGECMACRKWRQPCARPSYCYPA